MNMGIERSGERRRQGTALLIVLTLSMALLIMATTYYSTIHQSQPVNPNLLAFIQGDLLAQGITQIATLKVKELPAPLYYACIASRTGFLDPITTYGDDAILKGDLSDAAHGAITDPAIHFSTSFRMLSSKVYDEMNFQITVVASVTTSDNRKVARQFEHIIYGKRTGIFPP